MPKARTRIDKADPRQLSLFDLLQAAQELRPQESSEGSLNVQTRLCHALTNAVKTSGLSRWEIAGRMSHLLGTEITKFQLDAWTAESKEGHRFPAEYLPAFCVATSCREPLQILTDGAGLFCLPGPDALRAEIQRYAEAEATARGEKLRRKTLLAAIKEGGL